MKRAPVSIPWFLWIAILLAIGPGCARWGPGIDGTPCPVAWVPSESIDSSAASLRARMQIEIRGDEVHLELIVRDRPDELVVVGLARFGVRLFAVHQRGTALRVEGASTRQIEQLALWVMDALHRAYWIVPPAVVSVSEKADETDASDAIRWAWAGERISEFQTPGGLRREFSVPGPSTPRTAASSSATRKVTIDYHDTAHANRGTNPKVADGSISVHNPWCGYDATIVPVRRQARVGNMSRRTRAQDLAVDPGSQLAERVSMRRQESDFE